MFKKKSKDECRKTIEYILKKNILCGNALTLQDHQNEPLVFSKWELVEEKEFKSKRKEIQEKLIKFATRVPVFMYLTDYRERSLKDVITH